MRLIVGISGATGVVLGYRLLTALHSLSVETHLIVSESAFRNFEIETSLKPSDIKDLADYSYDNGNMAAAISSGSFRTDGMIVIPCSMKSLSNIATGNADRLLPRAADVCMKEGRKVVLVPREIPLSRLHLKNMLTAAELGCVIIPPVLTFYNGAVTVDEQIDHLIGKILMQFGLDYAPFKPWKG